MTTITKTDLPLSLLASGKVRDLYELPDTENVLSVATDRISCFDVVRIAVASNNLDTLTDGLGTAKWHSLQGRLTTLSEFWFTLLTTKIPDLQTHCLSHGLPQSLHGKLPSLLVAQLQRSSMVVRRLKVLPIESIVRGYITGSAWSSYQRDGTVCGIRLPKGLRESEKLEKPLWTPSTKVAAGEKDENISLRGAASIIGKEYASQVETLPLRICEAASDYARSQGIILADTKFEFGLDETTSPPSVVLIDEVLTPDSSRVWSVEKYEVGKSQESFDKQLLRDWLVREGLKGKEGVELPRDIVDQTAQRYKVAFKMLIGKEWEE